MLAGRPPLLGEPRHGWGIWECGGVASSAFCSSLEFHEASGLLWLLLHLAAVAAPVALKFKGQSVSTNVRPGVQWSPGNGPQGGFTSCERRHWHLVVYTVDLVETLVRTPGGCWANRRIYLGSATRQV